MPSPIAHSITGYFLKQEYLYRAPKLRKKIIFSNIFTLLTANAADLDFLPQLIFNAKFHRGPTHSIFFALIFCCVLSLVFSYLAKSNLLNLFAISFSIYASHLFLDFFTAGGLGMQILWPFASQYFKSDLSIFPAVNHSEGLFYSGHIVFITFELCYALLLISILKFQARKCNETN